MIFSRRKKMTKRKGFLLASVLGALLITGCDKHVDLRDKNIQRICADDGTCIEYEVRSFTLTKGDISVDTVENLAQDESVSLPYDVFDMSVEEFRDATMKLGDDAFRRELDIRADGNKSKMILFDLDVASEFSITRPVLYGACETVETGDIVKLGKHEKVYHPNASGRGLILSIDKLIANETLSANAETQHDFCVWLDGNAGSMGGGKVLELSNVLVYDKKDLNDLLTSEGIISE